MQRRHIAILPIVIALGIMFFRFVSAPKAVNPETGSVHKVGMSPQQEQQLGLQAYQEVLHKESANVIQSGPEFDRIKAVARRLAAAVAEKGDIQYNWQLSVVRSDQVNAFCLPGGEIVVYTAILPVAQNDAGLATVMGHEMGHAVARHSAQRMFRQNMAQTFLQGAQGSLWNMDVGQQQAVMGVLGAGAQYGVVMPFSRDQESEADHMGLHYMARAGYDPHEALEFWKRMEAQAGAGRQPAAFMSDHPSNGVRIQQLQDWMPEAEKEYGASTMKTTGRPSQSVGL